MRNIVIVEAHMHSVWFGSFLIALFMAFMGLKLKFSTTFVATTSTVPIHPGVTVIFPILGQGKGFCRKDAHCSQKHREREGGREREMTETETHRSQVLPLRVAALWALFCPRILPSLRSKGKLPDSSSSSWIRFSLSFKSCGKSIVGEKLIDTSH